MSVEKLSSQYNELRALSVASDAKLETDGKRLTSLRAMRKFKRCSDAENKELNCLEESYPVDEVECRELARLVNLTQVDLISAIRQSKADAAAAEIARSVERKQNAKATLESEGALLRASIARLWALVLVSRGAGLGQANPNDLLEIIRATGGLDAAYERVLEET